ncbi:nucleotide pyrophosphohydrolase [Aliifodinibius salicampi]|uniref:Nucleotide pyrophosphohydrolase n=1 Tax=Fodinibius salicampi TaxID=1920655 RepID=A0ABT3Q0E4_9BACT|nr:nucleotide pyrophosphohydrolase [Fodinibius salicampi]MCW9713561.1 nucleotide pyrophosphohydrolase [Fodinibius salicampi]
MDRLEKIIKNILEFREERDWEQFHNPKDLAISLNLEASELLEHFQWKSDEEIEEYIAENKDSISQELADILYWVLLISHDLDIDIESAVQEKLKLNAKKYPVEKAKGKHTKYTDL